MNQEWRENAKQALAHKEEWILYTIPYNSCFVSLETSLARIVLLATHLLPIGMKVVAPKVANF